MDHSQDGNDGQVSLTFISRALANSRTTICCALRARCAKTGRLKRGMSAPMAELGLARKIFWPA